MSLNYSTTCCWRNEGYILTPSSEDSNLRRKESCHTQSHTQTINLQNPSIWLKRSKSINVKTKIIGNGKTLFFILFSLLVHFCLRNPYSKQFQKQIRQEDDKNVRILFCLRRFNLSHLNCETVDATLRKHFECDSKITLWCLYIFHNLVPSRTDFYISYSHGMKNQPFKKDRDLLMLLLECLVS